ncbi:MAG TPA: RDD family protein [Puia sp.]|nr:RDD family protein [Puia sp.]
MENYYTDPNPQQDLLSGDLLVSLQQASAGKRFANYLIDLVVFYIFIIILYASLVRADVLSLDINPIVDRLLTLICYGFFMGIYEGIFRGRTLGKLITSTKAVNEDGTRISFSTALVRGLSRAVPFETFSAFGDPSHPWHDKWTRTYVVDLTRSTLPQ